MFLVTCKSLLQVRAMLYETILCKQSCVSNNMEAILNWKIMQSNIN